jgi:hypothetical protein
MATKKNDLSHWARNLIVKGLDNVAGALEPADETNAAAGAQPTPLHRLADHWRTLTAEERENIASRIIAGAGSALATLPVIAGAKRAAKPAPRRAPRPAAQPIEIPIDEKKKDKKKKKEKTGKDKKSRKAKKDRKEKKKTKKK